MRLALAAIDLVEPYVLVWEEGAAAAVPYTAAAAGGGRGGGAAVGGGSGGGGGAARGVGGCVELRWQVWGAIRVDEAYPLWRPRATGGEWRPVPGFAPLSGDGVWGAGSGSTALAPHTFSACVKLPADASGAIEIVVRARADSGWAQKPAAAYAPAQQP
eukprot:176921-Prymnesium_polylepis.1